MEGGRRGGETCESRPNRATAAGAGGVAAGGGDGAAGVRRGAGPGPGPGRLRAAAGGRGARPRRRAPGRDLAARHPPASRAEQPRVPHRRPRGRPPAGARHGGADRGRPHRRRRHPAGRPAGAGGGPAGRHGRAARHRAGGPAVRVARARHLQRPGGGRHARLRPRQPRRHPHGGGRRARLGARRPAGHREVHLPAGRGGGAGGRARRGRADARGGRLREPAARGRLRAARRSEPGGAADLPGRQRDGQRRLAPHRRAGPADPRRGALGRGRPDRGLLPDRPGAADRGQPPASGHAHAVDHHHRQHPRRGAGQHHPRRGGDGGDHPHVRRRGASGHPPPHPPDGGADRGERGGDGRGRDYPRLSGDRQRPRADRTDGPDPAAGGRRRSGRGAGPDDRRRGLLLLPARGAGHVLLPWGHSRGPGPGDRAGEPLAAVLRRRGGAAGGRSRPDQPDPRLHDGAVRFAVSVVRWRS